MPGRGSLPFLGSEAAVTYEHLAFSPNPNSQARSETFSFLNQISNFISHLVCMNFFFKRVQATNTRLPCYKDPQTILRLPRETVCGAESQSP